jgi:LuxR family transcriptional regulator, maltose regulon positive regulatory protein
LTVTRQSELLGRPLIEGKLRAPAPRAGDVPRERLLRRLAAAPAAPVVAVVAPPGFGKTTLLTQWAAQDPQAVAWLAIDDLDNDPTVLVTYLGAVVDRIRPVDRSFWSALAAPPERILATAVPRLAAELYRLERPALLILDDVDRLVDRTSLDALTALVDHLPPGVRIALAGRSEPPLPLARIRSQGRLLELGTEQLALDEEEAGALAAACGWHIGADEIRHLVVRTEGWAAGIYLAAHARAAGTGTESVAEPISGRERHIAAYLRSELGATLAHDDLALLTRTAVLERVDPSTAEAVSGIGGAAERLAAIAERHGLVRDLGGDGPVYRYHHLLREFLLAELDRREPGSAPALHLRAAASYAAAGAVETAVEQAIASGDADAAARYVAGAGLGTFYGGHPATLERWLARFDDDVLARHPALVMLAGWVHLVRGRPYDAERMADLAERVTFDGPPGDGTASVASGRAMLRAVMGRGGPRDVLANASFAVAEERPGSPWRANALWLLGAAHRLLGDLVAAEDAFTDAISAGAGAGTTTMVALAARCRLAIDRRDWDAAERDSREALATLDRVDFHEIVADLPVHAVAARVAIHHGDRRRARDELVRAQLVRPLASHAAPWFSVDALLQVARAYLALADPAGAQSALREAEQIARRRPALGVLVAELLDLRRRLAESAWAMAGSSTLTPAELRLLPLLPTYLSFQEIADRLAVSRNTVKTQAMSIYGKLEASSRGEAVERAVELGLLEPYPGLGPIDSRPGS